MSATMSPWMSSAIVLQPPAAQLKLMV
jgi:hypothetical protein